MSKIIYSENINASILEWLQKNSYSRIAVIVDEKTLEHCYPKLELDHSHTVIEIKSGEIEKNLSTCQLIWNELTKAQFDRNSLVINLGGGVIGDMGGFCAATFKRGIDFIQIPTTLLAQVDASIGGKLGIDFHHFKNHIGIFKEPESVFISSVFLDSLPRNQLRSGFSEVIKHALISDAGLWNDLKTGKFPDYDWQTIIKRSVQLKQDVVKKDPFENGLRKILNFGHTIGHAIESLRLDSDTPLLHGEAIAHGMVIESILAHQKEMLNRGALEEVNQFILSTYGKVKFDSQDIGFIMENVLQDKKNKGSRILMALIDDIGHAKWDCETQSDEILMALHTYDHY